ANDVEVCAQVTATDIQDLKVLVVKPVGALCLGDQFMRVEVCLDGVVLRGRVLRAEGEEHRMHKELLGRDLDTHRSPLALHPLLTVSGPSPDVQARLTAVPPLPPPPPRSPTPQ